VQPNARRSEIVGLYGDSLKIKIAAVPEDGKANAELISFLAEVLGIARANVMLIRSEFACERCLVSGVSVDLVRSKLRPKGEANEVP